MYMHFPISLNHHSNKRYYYSHFMDEYTEVRRAEQLRKVIQEEGKGQDLNQVLFELKIHGALNYRAVPSADHTVTEQSARVSLCCSRTLAHNITEESQAL